jgi:hypothetical protein
LAGGVAVIREFFQSKGPAREHPTEVECGWQVVVDSRRLLQLSTYGSDQRAREKKVSQTLQLDEARARELLEILVTTFPALGSSRRAE